MRIAAWPCPPSFEEYAVWLISGQPGRVLVIPALFDEANKLRRFTLDVMRALAEAGVSSVLPDWPGCNESLVPLRGRTLSGWREAVHLAARNFNASHVLAIRGGALIAPDHLPLVNYAPVAGATLLRGLLRATVLSEREAGREATRESLLERGQREGLVLSGYALNSSMLEELEAAHPVPAARTITQPELGAPALWLRAEPGDDPAQAAQLAALVAGALR